MLVDITPSPPDPTIATVLALIGHPNRAPTRVAEGVWLWPHFNPQYEVVEPLDHFVKSMGNLLHAEVDGRDPLVVMREDGILSSYGVCDGHENLLSHPDYAPVLAGPRKLTVFLTEVARAAQPERGGWRWHKWGPYIGSYESKHEYLYDEEIDRVFVFSIMEHLAP
mgnify:CR=1 FL=1